MVEKSQQRLLSYPNICWNNPNKICSFITTFVGISPTDKMLYPDMFPEVCREFRCNSSMTNSCWDIYIQFLYFPLYFCIFAQVNILLVCLFPTYFGILFKEEFFNEENKFV